MTSDSSPLYHFQPPWDTNTNVIWLASTLRLSRNLEKFLFPQKLETQKKEQLGALIAKTLLSLEKLHNPKVLLTEKMTILEREFLAEHFLLLEGLHNIENGSSFILDDSGKILFLCNVQDHITMQYTDTEGTIEKSWEKLIEIENAISQSFRFAYNEKFGFLTSDYSCCGTGFSISAFLHIPGLIHLDRLQSILETEISESVLYTSLQGNPDEFIADMLILQNNHTIGLHEENIISNIRETILRIVLAEKSARCEIKEKKEHTLKDQISRAIGTLKFSYTLEAKEALAAISLIKLGLELGWISGITIQDINQLFFECRRAHLILDLLKIASEGKITDQRAEFLREKTEKITTHFPE